MLEQIVRGPLLIPAEGGDVAFHPDGVLAADSHGVIQYAGAWAGLKLPGDAPLVRASEGTMLPPFVDLHTHIPQHPIRGRFAEGVADNPPGGRLLASLMRNVFPAEAKCADVDYARQVVREFYADTLAHGVVGGAAYMTVHAAATEAALEILPPAWSVGLVMMNQRSPANLVSDEENLAADYSRLAERFGRRVIVTDRFAVAVSSKLRKKGSQLAGRLGLRTQTHLNEQLAEKQLVERDLYPGAGTYAAVYRDDGLLDHDCILAHCIHQTPVEWPIITKTNSSIAHCPSSNLLLGSGLMPLDCVMEKKIDYAIATDVGAGPTVSLLAEMGRFLRVHDGKSGRATPREALVRATLAPARILGLDLGRLEPGRPLSFIEIRGGKGTTADEVIASLIPRDLDNPVNHLARVTLSGKTVFHA